MSSPFQIRSKNKYLWSEWSRPVTLTLYPSLYPNCSRTSPANDPPYEGTHVTKNARDSRRIMCVFSFVGSTIFEPEQTLPLWMYMVIGGSVCGAVVSVILLIGIVSLCKKHKQRKQMQRVFKVGC